MGVLLLRLLHIIVLKTMMVRSLQGTRWSRIVTVEGRLDGTKLLDVVSFCQCMRRTYFVLGLGMRNLQGPVGFHPFVVFVFFVVGFLVVCVLF